MVGNNSNSGKRLDGVVRQAGPVVPQGQTSAPQTPDVEPTFEDHQEHLSQTIEEAGETFVYQRPGRSDHRVRNRIVAAAAAMVFVVVVFIGFRAVLASQKIITRNIGSGAPALAGEIDPTKLKGEGDGRINILMLGIGGSGHAGSDLSDTIMVASIDPRTKDIAMLSIPRDLYVKIPGYGGTKINAANSYGESKHRGGGAELAKTTVSGILDIPIHYYVRVDFAAFRQAVNAVGGVNIYVDQALSDPEYPCDKDEGRACGFQLSAGQKRMDGALALKYVRCRKGNCGNDYGRAARQQKLLVALRQKALDVSTLTNPVKVLELINTAGSHMTTDMQPAEIKKFSALIKDLHTDTITNKVLDTSATGLLQESSMPGAGSVQIPKAGVGNYEQIQELVHSIFVDSYIKQENASLEVQNGTLKQNLATTVGKLLKSYNYNVVNMTSADNQSYRKTVIYDYTSGKKPYTISYLERRFKVRAQKASPPPTADGKTVDIRIIVGSDYKATGSTK